MTVVVPDAEPLVAVITAVPGATAVTTPAEETVATLGVPEDHVTVRPVSTLPLASCTLALNVPVCPTVNVGDCGETTTAAAAAAFTVSVADPLCPSLVAVIVAVPAATPVATPLCETVAIAVLLELHVTARPVSTLPLASCSVAVKVVPAPPTVVVLDGGATLTVATGAAVTVTLAVPVFPSLVAVMVALPADTPVTTPVDETVATFVALDVHVTVRPVSVVPFASVNVVANVVV